MKKYYWKSSHCYAVHFKIGTLLLAGWGCKENPILLMVKQNKSGDHSRVFTPIAYKGEAPTSSWWALYRKVFNNIKILTRRSDLLLCMDMHSIGNDFEKLLKGKQ